VFGYSEGSPWPARLHKLFDCLGQCRGGVANPARNNVPPVRLLSLHPLTLDERPGGFSERCQHEKWNSVFRSELRYRGRKERLALAVLGYGADDPLYQPIRCTGHGTAFALLVERMRKEPEKLRFVEDH